MLSVWLMAAMLVVADETRPAEAQPQIRAVDGQVTLHVQNLALSQILDRLAAATGMTLTYDGARPAAPITISVEKISETEAILKLMEGLGVSYVLRTDATGHRVDTLIVSGSGPGRVVANAQPASSAEQAYEEPVADYAHIPLDPAVAEAAGPQGKPDLNNPYLGLPAQHFPQAIQAQQGIDPTGSSGSRNMPPPPMFPGGASYPR